MNPNTLVTLTVEVSGQRLDQFVTAAANDLSRSEVQRLIKAGLVCLNGQPVKSSLRVEAGQAITVELPPAQDHTIQPEAIALDILYEDDDLVAINKPAGMVVHPAAGNEAGTLVNAALYYWPDMRRITGEDRPGIVHRLDKDTSGVIVLAKTSAALRTLQAQFKERSVFKQYLALVDGQPEHVTGLIDAPIGRDTRQRKRMAVIRNGRPAQSLYRVIETFEGHALLEVEPATGRTHQIRVHLNWLGVPVAGDTVYGRRKRTISASRLFLHARVLEVTSPSGGQHLRFEAPLPADLSRVLDELHGLATIL
jgi:23S rRNA pseudouridine1911/1915/1917 synthase